MREVLSIHLGQAGVQVTQTISFLQLTSTTHARIAYYHIIDRKRLLGIVLPRTWHSTRWSDAIRQDCWWW